MLLNYSTNNCVTIFDNVGNGMTGDTTVGYNLNDFELSNILEMSEFIVLNKWKNGKKNSIFLPF